MRTSSPSVPGNNIKNEVRTDRKGIYPLLRNVMMVLFGLALAPVAFIACFFGAKTITFAYNFLKAQVKKCQQMSYTSSTTEKDVESQEITDSYTTFSKISAFIKENTTAWNVFTSSTSLLATSMFGYKVYKSNEQSKELAQIRKKYELLALQLNQEKESFALHKKMQEANLRAKILEFQQALETAEQKAQKLLNAKELEIASLNKDMTKLQMKLNKREKSLKNVQNKYDQLAIQLKQEKENFALSKNLQENNLRAELEELKFAQQETEKDLIAKDTEIAKLDKVVSKLEKKLNKREKAMNFRNNKKNKEKSRKRKVSMKTKRNFFNYEESY